MTAFLIRVRRTSRRPLRLGTTNITNQGDGSVVDANDPLVKRDMSFYANNFVVLGPDEAGTAGNLETMNPNDATGTVTNASGVILFTGIELPKGLVVSSLTYVSVGAATTPTVQYAGIYASDGTTLTRKAQSADGTTTAIAANAAVLRTMASAYTTDAAGIYYLAWLIVSGGNPSLAGQLPANAVVANIDAAKIYATLAAQSVLPTSQALSGLTAANGIPYVKIA